jgi:aminoglycoside phosphotransferase
VLEQAVFRSEFCGLVLNPLGEAGVGDRYIDIVAGIWSLRYNYGKGSVRNLLDGYGLQALDRGS